MIITQKFINRCDLQKNPDVMYLFGDNTRRRGMGGQAGHMRNEPNAIGVATKMLPSQMENSYFSDDDIFNNIKVMWDDLKPAFIHLTHKNRLLVIPEDGLGTGLSELPTRAPRTNRALTAMLQHLYVVDKSLRPSETYLDLTKLYDAYLQR